MAASIDFYCQKYTHTVQAQDVLLLFIHFPFPWGSLQSWGKFECHVWSWWILHIRRRRTTLLLFYIVLFLPVIVVHAIKILLFRFFGRKVTNREWPENPIKREEEFTVSFSRMTEKLGTQNDIAPEAATILPDSRLFHVFEHPGCWFAFWSDECVRACVGACIHFRPIQFPSEWKCGWFSRSCNAFQELARFRGACQKCWRFGCRRDYFLNIVLCRQLL